MLRAGSPSRDDMLTWEKWGCLPSEQCKHHSPTKLLWRCIGLWQLQAAQEDIGCAVRKTLHQRSWTPTTRTRQSKKEKRNSSLSSNCLLQGPVPCVHGLSMILVNPFHFLYYFLRLSSYDKVCKLCHIGTWFCQGLLIWPGSHLE